MWNTFRCFIGKHSALTTLSFGSHYQMAYTVLQMYLDSTMFLKKNVLALHSLAQESLFLKFSSISKELLSR